MKPKEGAELLDIKESSLMQIMNGKRKITMPLAKRIHSRLGIDANTILEFA